MPLALAGRARDVIRPAACHPNHVVAFRGRRPSDTHGRLSCDAVRQRLPIRPDDRGGRRTPTVDHQERSTTNFNDSWLAADSSRQPGRRRTSRPVRRAQIWRTLISSCRLASAVNAVVRPVGRRRGGNPAKPPNHSDDIPWQCVPNGRRCTNSGGTRQGPRPAGTAGHSSGIPSADPLGHPIEQAFEARHALSCELAT
jgi:hypothetical protein